MSVVEDRRLHGQEQRSDEPGKTPYRAASPEIYGGHSDARKHHSWKAIRRTRLTEDVHLLMQVLTRQRKEPLHEPRMLVVRSPIAIDHVLLEGLRWVVEKDVEPLLVFAGRAEVEALVTRIPQIVDGAE